jgi:hypothetical protein
LIEGPVSAGSDGSGTIMVTNTGIRSFRFAMGAPAVGRVVNSDGEVVGVFTGSVSLLGIGGTVDSGRTARSRFFFGTASCDAEIGYSLLPGDYWVTLEVQLDGRSVLATSPIEVK